MRKRDDITGAAGSGSVASGWPGRREIIVKLSGGGLSPEHGGPEDWLAKLQQH